LKGGIDIFIRIFLPWIMITIGSVTLSFGYVVLIFPLNLFEGGITGVGLIANKALGLPIGVTSLIITLLIYAVATKILGKGFGFKSLYATVVTYILIDAIPLLGIKPLTDDILLASFYGAILAGIGMGLVFMYGASTGGSDAIAQIMKKVYGIPIGRSLIAVDFIVLSIAIYFVGVEIIMYSFIFIFVQIKVVDTILNGLEANQKVTIVTTEPEKIRDEILFRLERGITMYEAVGGFSGDKKHSLITVVPKKETPVLKKIISGIDSEVFVIIEDVHQVYGEGFQKLLK